MANKSVFATIAGKLLPRADATNKTGAAAYQLGPKAALAQMAVTGTFNRTFYADGRDQVAEILALAKSVDATFLAKTAVHAAESGHMKDMPAFLLALLSTLESDAFNRAFPRVVTNGKMLRSFVQVMRSGAAGRKSLGSRPKRLVEAWLEAASVRTLLQASVGNDPSLDDVIRMVHPKPATASRRALYAWIVGRPYDVAALPEEVRAYEAFKADRTLPLPDVPFQMLTALPLTAEQWAETLKTSSWQQIRQNLNSYVRHGCLELDGFTKKLVDRLENRKEVERARLLPYQVMTTLSALDRRAPQEIHAALLRALDHALSNVPKLEGKVVVCPDVSGSMASPVTGYRPGATTTTRCIDVAALVTAALLRTTPKSRVLPFAETVKPVSLDADDGVMANAARLAALGGGGTNCSAPLEQLVRDRAKVDLVIFVSDNQSWIDWRSPGAGATEMMEAWQRLKAMNPKARLVCIDLQPYTTSHVADRADILNVGGFSDRVFDAIADFAVAGARSAVDAIEAIEL